MKVEDILHKLPTREEVGRLVGLQSHAHHDDLLTLLSVFGTGILLGAGLALLFAPKPGQDLRREITQKLNSAADNLRRQHHNDEHASALPA